MSWFKRLVGAGRDTGELSAEDIRRRLGRYAEPARVAGTARDVAPFDESSDAWLQDAVWYAAHGRWFAADEAIRTTPGDLLKIRKIAEQMRQLAVEGRYPVWGKTDAAQRHRRIPAEFWADNQIDVLRLLADGNPENVCTECRTPAPHKGYASLRVNRSATERLWPAAEPDRRNPLQADTGLALA
jgi:hypothetical protein